MLKIFRFKKWFYISTIKQHKTNNMNTKYNTTKEIIEVIETERKIAQRQYDDAFEAIEEGQIMATGDLMAAKAMLRTTNLLIATIKDNINADMKQHFDFLYHELVRSTFNTLSSRNLMNSTSNTHNMMALHTITAKASLAETLFNI